MELVKEVRAALAAAGIDDDEARVYRRGEAVTVALGLDLVGASAANGGNVAGAIVSALEAAGFSVKPSNWEHLLAGRESVVTRVAYTTRRLAQMLYGTETPSRAQVTSAGQWADRQPGLEPMKGFRSRLWPVETADAALAERASRAAEGKSGRGNPETGERKAAAARAGHEARRARSTGTGDAT